MLRAPQQKMLFRFNTASAQTQLGYVPDNPPDDWVIKIKKQLYMKNLRAMRPREIPREKEKLAVRCANQLFDDKKKKQIIIWPDPKLSHGYYSHYVTLTECCHFDDQLINTFPYLASLGERFHTATKNEIYQKISNALASQEDYKSAQSQWEKCLNFYLCPLDMLTKLSYYLEILKFGTKIIPSLALQCHSECSLSVFTWSIMEMQSYFNKPQSYRVSSRLSVNKNEEINQGTLAKTSKNLFCPICLLYDCGRHTDDDKAQGNDKAYQYVHPKNLIPVEEHIPNAVRLVSYYSHLVLDTVLQAQQAKQESEYCSAHCYRLLNAESFKTLCSNRSTLLSPIFRSLIKIAFKMYSYKPCMAVNLMQKDKDSRQPLVTCELIFLYLLQDYNLPKRLTMKLEDTEINALMNERAIEINSRPTKQRRKVSSVKKKFTSQIISACYHYFLNERPSDLGCHQCSCRSRGYCLPDCACGPECSIQAKGCQCRKEFCNTDKCPCFKNKFECDPNICGQCYNQSRHNKECRNNQIMKGVKCNIKIGPSMIKEAGLGAFAGEDIQKGQLVTIYTGDIIEQEIEEIRQNLSLDNLFYNFDSEDGAIDSKFMGNKSRFINHQDEGKENLEAKETSSNGKNVIAFYAIRDIKQHEQLYFDYDGNGQLSEHHHDKYPFIRKKK